MVASAAAARRSCSRLLLNPRTRLASARSSRSIRPSVRPLARCYPLKSSDARTLARRPAFFPAAAAVSSSVAPVTQLFVVAIECASNCLLSLSIPEVTGRLTSQSVSHSVSRSLARARLGQGHIHTDTHTRARAHIRSSRSRT